MVNRGLPTEHIGPVGLTVGSFNGVHHGHFEVIRHLEAMAIADHAAPALSEKLGHLEAAGLQHAIVMRFDRELASRSPQEVVAMLTAVMDIRVWAIGFDFAFGRGRTGNADWLRSHGHRVEVVPPFRIDGRELHSSEIRRLITTGEVEEANRLLGREYEMTGPVEAGAQVGRTLGFPTANIS